MSEKKSGRLPQRFAVDFADVLDQILNSRPRGSRPTGQQIANALRRSDTYVSDRRNGKASWTVDDIDVIAELLEVDGLTLMSNILERMEGEGTMIRPDGTHDIPPDSLWARVQTQRVIARKAANPGDVILFPGDPARTHLVTAEDVSEVEDNIEDLYDEPSAAHPVPRNDVEGDVDPDLQL